MSLPLADMTPAEVLVRLADLEESYDIAYRSAQEADWPNGPIDDPRPAFIEDLLAANRKWALLKAAEACEAAGAVAMSIDLLRNFTPDDDAGEETPRTDPEVTP